MQHCRQVGVRRNASLCRSSIAHIGGRFHNRGQLEYGIAANRRNEGPAGRSHSYDSDADFAGHGWLSAARLVTLAPQE
jgi:hypothetical protein